MPSAEAELLPLCWYRQVWEQDQEFTNNPQSEQSSTQARGSECSSEAMEVPIPGLLPSIFPSQETCLVSEDTASPVH